MDGTADNKTNDGPIQINVPPEVVEEVRRAGGDPSDPRQWLLAIQNNLTFHNATLLSAELLRELAQLDEASRQHLITAYRTQQAHRHALESQEVAANIRIRQNAQRNGMVIGIVGLLLSAAVVIVRSDPAAATIAGIIALISIGGPVTANILARRVGKDDLNGPR